MPVPPQPQPTGYQWQNPQPQAVQPSPPTRGSSRWLDWIVGSTRVEGRVIDVKEDPPSGSGFFKGLFIVLTIAWALGIVMQQLATQPLTAPFFCCGVLFMAITFAIVAAINKRSGSGPLPNRMTRLHDLRLQVIETGTSQVINIRLEHVGTDAVVPLQAEVHAQGRMRGNVCYATRLEVDSGRGIVKLWPRRFWFWRIGSVVLLILVISQFQQVSAILPKG